MSIKIILFSFFFIFEYSSCNINYINAKLTNDRPIIGILAQELSQSLENVYGGNYSSYIAASYVKFVESAGARVVPIMINQDDLYYEKMINSVNGILIPGGANWYNESGYGKAGEILMDLAIDLNSRGDYFPIWGTCLGFEFMIYYLSAKEDPRITCDAWDIADRLDFEPDGLESKMFSSAPAKAIDILSRENVTSNFHRWCVTKEGLAANGLSESLHILATSVDKFGLRYIAAFESRTMPFYGVQFHPEKPLFEWNTKEESIPHSANAIDANIYFAQFFINEARQNGHAFADSQEEYMNLIYNYSPTFTGAENLIYDQCYFFV